MQDQWEGLHVNSNGVMGIQKDRGNYWLCSTFGSTNEAEYYLILAKDLKYLTEANFTELTDNINEIKAMLILLINR